MTIKVELNPETGARLAAEARTQDISLEKCAERFLQEALACRSAQTGQLTLDEFHEMLNALAEESQELPTLPTESFTRASFYEDRA